MNFDDNALYRHKDIAELRDETEEDPKELEASKFDLNYIALDGDHRLHGQRRRARHGDHGHHQALRLGAGQLPRRRRRRHQGKGDRGVQDHHLSDPNVKASW